MPKKPVFVCEDLKTAIKARSPRNKCYIDLERTADLCCRLPVFLGTGRQGQNVVLTTVRHYPSELLETMRVKSQEFEAYLVKYMTKHYEFTSLANVKEIIKLMELSLHWERVPQKATKYQSKFYDGYEEYA